MRGGETSLDKGNDICNDKAHKSIDNDNGDDKVNISISNSLSPQLDHTYMQGSTNVGQANIDSSTETEGTKSQNDTVDFKVRANATLKTKEVQNDNDVKFLSDTSAGSSTLDHTSQLANDHTEEMPLKELYMRTPAYVLKPSNNGEPLPCTISVTSMTFSSDGRYLRAEYNGDGSWCGTMHRLACIAPIVKIWDTESPLESKTKANNFENGESNLPKSCMQIPVPNGTPNQFGVAVEDESQNNDEQSHKESVEQQQGQEKSVNEQSDSRDDVDARHSMVVKNDTSAVRKPQNQRVWDWLNPETNYLEEFLSCHPYSRYVYRRELANKLKSDAHLATYDGCEVSAKAFLKLEHTLNIDDVWERVSKDKTTYNYGPKQMNFDSGYVNGVFDNASAASSANAFVSMWEMFLKKNNFIESSETVCTFTDICATCLQLENRYHLTSFDLDQLRQQALVDREIIHEQMIDTLSIPQRQVNTVPVLRKHFVQFVRKYIADHNSLVSSVILQCKISENLIITGDDFGRVSVWSLPVRITSAPLVTSTISTGRIHSICASQIPHSLLASEKEDLCKFSMCAVILALDNESNLLSKWILNLSKPTLDFRDSPQVFKLTWSAEDEERIGLLVHKNKKFKKKYPKFTEYYDFNKKDPVDQMLLLNLKPTALEKSVDLLSRCPSVDTLQLERIYGRSLVGYRSKSVYLDVFDRILYPAGSFVVLFDRERQQQVYCGPQEDKKRPEKITAFCVSDSGLLAATGWSGKSPVSHNDAGRRSLATVDVWQTTNRRHIAQLSNIFHHEILFLQFSKDRASRFLIIIGGAPEMQKLVIYDIHNRLEWRLDIGNLRVRGIACACPCSIDGADSLPIRCYSSAMPQVTIVGDHFVYSINIRKSNKIQGDEGNPMDYTITEANYTVGLDPVSFRIDKELFSCVASICLPSSSSMNQKSEYCNKVLVGTGTPNKSGRIHEFSHEFKCAQSNTPVDERTKDVRSNLQAVATYTICEEAITCLTSSEKSKIILCGTAKQMVFLLDAQTFERRFKVDFAAGDVEANSRITNACFSRDCSEIIASCLDGSILCSSAVYKSQIERIFDGLSVKNSKRENKSREIVFDSSFLMATNGEEFVVVGKSNGEVLLWDANRASLLTQANIFGESSTGTCTVGN